METLARLPSVTEPVYVMPGAADLNAAVYDRALKSLAEVLENSFGASASCVEISLQRLRGGAEALVFVDDGHGASCDLSAVFNAGYSLGEGRAAKEQNRMFHRGLVLCLDSLGADCHLFSQTRDAGADAVALQVARYGPALTALLEEPQGDDRQPLQTVTAQLLPGGAMLQRGQPAHGAVGPLLTCNSAFEDVAALRVFVKTALGERHCGPDAPGFGGVVVLRPGLGIARHGDDLVQGSFSLRSFIRQRYVPLGFGVSHVAAPACKVFLNGIEAPLAQWDAGNRSPLYVRRVGGYKLSLRMHVQPAAASGPGSSRYAPPSVRAVLRGTCIATEVPSKSFEASNSKYLDYVGTSNWMRRNDTARSLDGHERDGFTHLVALLSDSEAASKNGSKNIRAPICRDGSQVAKPASILEKDDYVTYNRAMRAVLGGDGIACLVAVKPADAVDASNMFTAHKGALKNEALCREIRLLAHQAVVHWARAAFKLKHPGEASHLWPKVVEERAAAAKAKADAQAKKAAAAAEAAAAAAAAAVSLDDDDDEEEDEDDDDDEAPARATPASAKLQQPAHHAADDAAAAATATPAAGRGARRKRAELEEEEEDGGGAAGFDDHDESEPQQASPKRTLGQPQRRLPPLQPQKCAMCSRTMDASTAARAAAAAAEQKREMEAELQRRDAELAAAKARIADLEGLLLRIAG